LGSLCGPFLRRLLRELRAADSEAHAVPNGNSAL